MIKEDYVSFETAKLLKEKGFDADTEHDMWYVVENFSTGCHWNSCTYKVGDITREYDEKCCIAMPTLQMAMKWLREKGIIITIVYMRYSLQTIGSQMMFGFNIQNTQGDMLAENIEVAYDSYEQAEKDAIKYSLENLI